LCTFGLLHINPGGQKVRYHGVGILGWPVFAAKYVLENIRCTDILRKDLITVFIFHSQRVKRDLGIKP
jgi:hypothetical protein